MVLYMYNGHADVTVLIDDCLTDAMAHTMESVTELKDKIEKQDVEIRVIKGGKTQNA